MIDFILYIQILNVFFILIFKYTNNYLKEAKNHYKNCIYKIIFFGNEIKEAKNIINDYKDIKNNNEKPEHKMFKFIDLINV